MTIQYDDGPRQLKLPTIPAADGKRRLVGVFPTFSPKLDVNPYFYQAESVASRVFTKEDAGAEIVAFGTHSVNTNAIDPTTPLLDYLHKHASESIELKLRRSDGTPRTVTLPPQSLKTLGLRFAIGPITALVDNGPAKKNGLQVGDVITQLDGNSDIDAYSLAIALVGRKTPVQLKARRGTDDGAIELDVTLDPSQMLQTLSPTQNNGAVLAVNALGIAYTVLPSVVLADRASFSEATATSSESESAISSIAEDEFQSGDVVKKITVQFPGGKLPPSLSDASYASIVSKLAKGVELDESTTIVDFVDWLQMMPVGTTFDILAVRPAGGRVIQITRSVTESELVWFDRGIGFAPTEAIQKATSFGEAMSLGMRRGVWDLSAVFRSLKMIGQGNVGAKDIGGPIRIAQAAWYQANRGISPLLLFLTMLSMNLAILNFLPIPALDGGHMMFLIAEAVRGRRVDEQWEMRLTMLGVLALLALMAFVIFNDIYQGLM
jgi:regulator of sigma E protease